MPECGQKDKYVTAFKAGEVFWPDQGLKKCSRFLDAAMTIDYIASCQNFLVYLVINDLFKLSKYCTALSFCGIEKQQIFA